MDNLKVSQTLDDMSTSLEKVLDGSVVVTPTKSIGAEFDEEDGPVEELIIHDYDDNDFIADKKSRPDMELILSTLKANALDLALTEQIEHLQSYNSQLLELLQSEKKRCDGLLKRNDLLSREVCLFIGMLFDEIN